LPLGKRSKAQSVVDDMDTVYTKIAGSVVQCAEPLYLDRIVKESKFAAEGHNRVLSSRGMTLIP